MDCQIINSSVDRKGVLLHDAARPFVVVGRYHGGYKSGTQRKVLGRYASMRGAKAAIRAGGHTLIASPAAGA